MAGHLFTESYFQPAGDCALLVTLGDRIDAATNRKVHQFSRLIGRHPLEGLGECVPGYSTLLIHYNPLVVTYQELASWLMNLDPGESEIEEHSRLVEIPVVYGGAGGPDLAFVAQYHNLTEDEVIRIHSSREYPVYMMGFMPGFPYLGGMDPAIAVPRLSTPRSLVPAGSVGIAGEQTGIYPLNSPGGWRIIGKALASLFDISRDPPFFLSPGDVVVFQPVWDKSR